MVPRLCRGLRHHERRTAATALIAQLDRILTWLALLGGGVTLIFMTGFSVWNVLIMRKALNC